MKTKCNITLTLLTVLTVFIYSACRKNDREEQTDTSTAQDNAEMQSVFSGIWKQVCEVMDSSSVSGSSCVVDSITPNDTVTWPKTLTIDYGTTGCLSSDGISRKGRITAVFTGRYSDSLVTVTITLTNYYHNNSLIQGTQVIKNKGHNSSGHLVYNVVINNANYTSAKGSMTWSTNQNRECIEGENTDYNFFDDVYLVTGTASGRGINGNSYSVTINSPLRLEADCQWITSGSFTVKPQNYPPILLSYGSGACDNLATAELNNVLYDVTLY